MEALALAPLLIVATLGIGWLVWSVVEWRDGRTPSYRVLGLRVVRRADDTPARLWRSAARTGLCCLLVLPTVVVCGVVGLCFVFGASPPDGLLRTPRQAPWDSFTATRVTDERARPAGDGAAGARLEPIDLAHATRPSGTHRNGRATNP